MPARVAAQHGGQAAADAPTIELHVALGAEGLVRLAARYNVAQMLERREFKARYESGKPLEWKKVHDLPDYVYFNHSIHVAKGVGCATCHVPSLDLASAERGVRGDGGAAVLAVGLHLRDQPGIGEPPGVRARS